MEIEQLEERADAAGSGRGRESVRRVNERRTQSRKEARQKAGVNKGGRCGGNMCSLAGLITVESSQQMEMAPRPALGISDIRAPQRSLAAALSHARAWEN